MISEAETLEIISKFYCSKDPDVENFLKNRNKAILYEQKSKSRTYITFNEEAMNEGTFQLYSYFTVAIQSFKIPDVMSQNQIRKLDGLYAKKGNESITEIPVFLIGQLGKNELYPDRITGDEIIETALSVIGRAKDLVGGRVVLIECNDIPKLVDFYERNDFTVIRKDPEDGQLQMIRRISQ